MEKTIDGLKYEAIVIRSDIVGWRLKSNWNNKNNEIRIPDNINGTPIKIISASAFSMNPFLHHIEIPDSVELIEEKAFYLCNNLKTVTLYKSSHPNPHEIVSIYTGAFESCRNLKSFVSEKACLLNGPDVFRDCFELSQVGHNNKIFGSIYSNCFRNCLGLKELHIISNNCRLWTNCFYGCTNLGKIRFDCEWLTAPKAILNILSKKHIICKKSSPLAEMAYSGSNVEVI